MAEKMTPEQAQNVKYRMEAEGFHYCFNGYSNWNDIKDPEFQKLRKYYLQHAKLLKEYVEMCVNETNDDE